MNDKMLVVIKTLVDIKHIWYGSESSAINPVTVQGSFSASNKALD